MIIKIIIVFIIYIVGVIVSTILDAKLSKNYNNINDGDKYISLLSWVSVFICGLLCMIDYIYNKFNK